MVRGVRGAITVTHDVPEELLEATRELLDEMVSRNGIEVDDIASVLFSLSPDLKSAFPAAAARRMETWKHVPLFCTQELAVDGGLARCIRALIHWNTDKAPARVRHVYLREAKRLRPDLAESGGL